MRVMSRTSARLSVFASAALLLSTLSASAGIINVVNGGFESVAVANTSNQIGYHTNGTSTIQNVTGWTNNSNGALGYNFVFMGNSTTDSNGQYGTAYGDAGTLGLWGNNGITPSPLGGNFLAMDGAYDQATVSQALTGLTVGMDTQVSFYYAGAQQYGFTGPTTEAFTVSLTNTTANTTESHSTPILSNANHGFTGWQYTTINFTPTSSSETLSFLAAGTPSGVPPFSLLDGVSVVQVTPEPSTLALLGSGILAVGGLVRRRRSSL